MELYLLYFQFISYFYSCGVENLKYLKIGFYKCIIWFIFFCGNVKVNYGCECYFVIFFEIVSICIFNVFKMVLGVSKMKQS